MNSEKSRTFVALGLCLVFFLGWQKFYAEPKAKAYREAVDAARAADAAAEAERAAAESRRVETDSRASRPAGVEPADRPTTRTDARPEAPPAERVEVLENRRLRLTFSNVGASLRKAELLEYKRAAGLDEPLNLLHRYAGFAEAFELRSLSDPKTYAAEQPWAVSRDADGALVFTLENGVGTFNRPYRVTKRVAIAKDAPLVDVSFSFEYFGSETSAVGSALDQKWRFTPAGALTVDGESYGVEERQGVRSALFRVDPDGKEEYLETALVAAVKFERPEERLNPEKLRLSRHAFGGTRRFVADLNTYFGVYAALTDMPGVEATVAGVPDPTAAKDDPVRTRTDLEFDVRPKKGGEPVKHALRVYFGPTDETVLASALAVDAPELTTEFSRVYKHALGMFSFVGRAVLWLLHALHSAVGSWGWAIVLMTVCVRLLLFPINKRSQNAMRRHGEVMNRLKPQLDKLKEKYKDNAQAYAQAQMALFKSEKVSMVPISGCLPLFLQIPVFYGLFSGLRASIDLRQSPFLWAKDLSLPDHFVTFDKPITNPMKWFEACTCCFPPGMSDKISGLHLLPLLMTVAWIVSSMTMPRPANETPEQAQQRKMMLFMPFMFGFTMYGYAAALSLYWLTSSLVGIVESKIIRALWDKAHPKKA